MASAIDEVISATMDLGWALMRLDRALDAVGDDGEACTHISKGILVDLGRLTGRISRGKAPGGW